VAFVRERHLLENTLFSVVGSYEGRNLKIKLHMQYAISKTDPVPHT